MIGPNLDQRQDFLAKVAPVISEVCQREEEAGRKAPAFARCLNLCMGHEPKTKAEKAFQDALLRAIWARWPNALYPIMCAAPPPSPKPDLRVLDGGREDS